VTPPPLGVPYYADYRKPAYPANDYHNHHHPGPSYHHHQMPGALNRRIVEDHHGRSRDLNLKIDSNDLSHQLKRPVDSAVYDKRDSNRDRDRDRDRSRSKESWFAHFYD
jgi:hypothetical protein